jgi:5-methyltetrahydropteroyltriglutamate--homocysteine methyltransferase
MESPERLRSICVSVTPRLIHERPPAYSFLTELADSQFNKFRSRPPSRHSTVLCWRTLAGKQIILGVLDLSKHDVETPK